jgi:NAD(P)-dependent dehydrogenase (short-subunit alcohol dehydrogenase family)
MKNSLEEKVSIVTGGAQGIGKAIANRLGWDGMRVVVADIEEDLGEKTAQEIRQAGGEAVFVRTDVANPADVRRLIEETIDRRRRLDLLVNNAGGLTAPAAGSEDLLKMPLETWEADLRLNLTGPFLTCQAALRVMKHGAIVNISSVNGLVAIDSPAYSAAKAGLLALTRHIGENR